jgi:hypothetical protein
VSQGQPIRSPGSIALMFDEVKVQNDPACPVYSEHSFVTWRSPLRGEAATAGASPASDRIADAITMTIRVERIRCPSARGAVSPVARHSPGDQVEDWVSAPPAFVPVTVWPPWPNGVNLS